MRDDAEQRWIETGAGDFLESPDPEELTRDTAVTDAVDLWELVFDCVVEEPLPAIIHSRKPSEH